MAFRLTFITPGKHDASVDALIHEYEKRLSRFCAVAWQVVAGGDQAKEIAATKKRLEGAGTYVVLDERGSIVTTAEIAGTFESLMTGGQSSLTVVIGGAYGLDDEIRNGALAVWAFGRITLPHQLMRILALEQSYRAFTILDNHPYHHS